MAREHSSNAFAFMDLREGKWTRQKWRWEFDFGEAIGIKGMHHANN
jgi:hypothetical protein